MKKYERIIIYCLLLFTSTYCIWAHNKLHLIYQINRETLVPAYEKLQNIKNNSPDDRLYSIPSSIRGAGNELYKLCKAMGSLEMGAYLKFPSLSEGTRYNIINQLDWNLKILEQGTMPTSLVKANKLLIDATQAEIEVLNYEIQYPEKSPDDEEARRLMDKSMTIRAKADAEIFSLMYKI